MGSFVQHTKTPTLNPPLTNHIPNVSINVDLPTPGDPLKPIRIVEWRGLVADDTSEPFVFKGLIPAGNLVCTDFELDSFKTRDNNSCAIGLCFDAEDSTGN
jgi:hypothetical protein